MLFSNKYSSPAVFWRRRHKDLGAISLRKLCLDCSAPKMAQMAKSTAGLKGKSGRVFFTREDAYSGNQPGQGRNGH